MQRKDIAAYAIVVIVVLALVYFLGGPAKPTEGQVPCDAIPPCTSGEIGP